MKAFDLYDKLERDFIKPELSDSWIEMWFSKEDKMTSNFKERSMWVVYDFSNEILKVITATFLSDKIIQEIIKKKVENSLLFVHHPMSWDIRKKSVFDNISKESLELLEKSKISVYNLHVPLDNYSQYSTSVTFAKALNLKIVKLFMEYRWGLAWVICEQDFESIKDLQKIIENVVWHKTKLYLNWSENIKNEKIAIVAGWWLDPQTLKEMQENNLKTLITWVSLKNAYSKALHEIAQKNQINIIWATHYSTEKFTCIAMVDYFKNLWLPAEFIEDEPILEDL